MRFKDKIAIITGCSSGVGRETARLMAAEGAVVYAVARRANRLEELKDSVAAAGAPGAIIPCAADLMAEGAILDLFAKVKDEQGRLDILINNAGALDGMYPVGETDDETYEWVMGLNVTVPFKTMREAVKMMGKGSAIVNVSSIGGLMGGKAGAAYTASKHALNGLTKNTAIMYDAQGIRTNAVAPGGIQTEMIENLGEMSPHGLEVIGRGQSVSKMSATAEEIAKCILFLASDDASNVNGQILVSDGGLTTV